MSHSSQLDGLAQAMLDKRVADEGNEWLARTQPKVDDQDVDPEALGWLQQILLDMTIGKESQLAELTDKFKRRVELEILLRARVPLIVQVCKELQEALSSSKEKDQLATLLERAESIHCQPDKDFSKSIHSEQHAVALELLCQHETMAGRVILATLALLQARSLLKDNIVFVKSIDATSKAFQHAITDPNPHHKLSERSITIMQQFNNLHDTRLNSNYYTKLMGADEEETKTYRKMICSLLPVNYQHDICAQQLTRCPGGLELMHTLLGETAARALIPDSIYDSKHMCQAMDGLESRMLFLEVQKALKTFGADR